MNLDVVYGSALWFASTKVNCHHLTERLSATTPVLFVESVGARVPRAHEWRRILPRLLRSFLPLRRVGTNLWVFSPIPAPLYVGRGARWNSWFVGLQVRALCTVMRWRCEVAWIFHPMGLGTALTCGARALVYYCVDDHAANPGVDPEVVRAMEKELVSRVAVTIVTGEPLARRLRPMSADLRVMPNVVDTELFDRAPDDSQHDVLVAMDRLRRPRLGYLGNLAAYKIDLALLYEVARRRPSWSVVLVGPRNQGDTGSRIETNEAPDNVFFMGDVPHRLAPAVIDRFDIGLLPSAQHEIMAASFPLKFFEYLLRGRPVVARSLPSLAPFSDWYLPAETAMDFESQIDKVLKSDTTIQADARKAFARGFGWSRRIQDLVALRNDLLRRGS